MEEGASGATWYMCCTGVCEKLVWVHRDASWIHTINVLLSRVSKFAANYRLVHYYHVIHNCTSRNLANSFDCKSPHCFYEVITLMQVIVSPDSSESR